MKLTRAEANYELLLARASLYEMSSWEKRARSISFAAGNVMIDRPQYDEWLVRKWAAEVWETGARS